MARLDERVGPIHVEPVSVGIFLKRARGFAELRPMTKWVAVSFTLHAHARAAAGSSRKVYRRRRAAKYHVVNVRDAGRGRRAAARLADRGLPRLAGVALRYSKVWWTASTLLPSGSRTKAPK